MAWSRQACLLPAEPLLGRRRLAWLPLTGLLLAGPLLVGTMLAGPAAAQAPPFDPVGRWRFLHTDGSPFIGRLTADQAATSNFGTGERGIWRWEGNAVRMLYTSGWDDLLVQEADGRFVKRAWGPGADRCGPPTNQGPAERIAADPGGPL